MMTTLHIEHGVRSFDAWKESFDRDPIGRKRSGVRRYQVLRPIDDPNYVSIDLEFDERSDAEAFLGALRELWQAAAREVMVGGPQTRILEKVESDQYE
jgi:hypothetical protein